MYGWRNLVVWLVAALVYGLAWWGAGAEPRTAVLNGAMLACGALAGHLLANLCISAWELRKLRRGDR